MILQVKSIVREPTSFFVESFELRCVNPHCSRLVKRFPALLVPFSMRQVALLKFVSVWAQVERVLDTLRRKAFRQLGDSCPKCGGALEQRWHKVDIAAFNTHGACGCEHFQFTLEKEVRRQKPDERWLGQFRCIHIEAARDFAIDLAIRAFEKDRLVLAAGRKEDDAP